MTCVLLAPHHDDETLFAAFLAQRFQPDLIVCTRAEIQARRGGPTHVERSAETSAAFLGYLVTDMGQRLTEWDFSDVPDETDYAGLENAIRQVASAGYYDFVIAPVYEPGGHEHHNAVGYAALDAFGPENTIGYYTYRRGMGRSTGGVMAQPTPNEIINKLHALACYTSQIVEPSTRPWFMGALDEWHTPIPASIAPPGRPLIDVLDAFPSGGH